MASLAAVSLDLEAVVSHVLGTLPKRYVPARTLLTVCVELLVALIDTWLMVESELQEAYPNGSSSSQRGTSAALCALVGNDCAVAWQAEALDRVKRGEDRGRLLEALQALMENSIVGSREVARADRQSARRLGACWVLAALDDILAAVVAHCANKPAAPTSGGGGGGAAQRPGSASASRPGTAGRPGTGNTSLPAGSSESSSRPTSSRGTPASSRPELLSETGRSLGAHMGEKHRLIALKHLVATVRQERSLQACKVLEVCLVEVANGASPLLDVDSIMVIEAYRERLRDWATQEAESSGIGLDQCIEQAMKGVGTAATPRNAVTMRSTPKAASSNKVAFEKKEPEAPPPLPAPQKRAGGGWLPKAFVRDFNAEGDEVEPEVEELSMPTDSALASFSPEPRRAAGFKKPSR
mmetsp:Transcript_57566/g.106360  ORF Transcript_57566/g.106360 Transcript_57566/m.106360 type:complete len:411 (-) Transcript_57566:41-1273(-)